jgi:hypothetical protein
MIYYSPFLQKEQYCRPHYEIKHFKNIFTNAFYLLARSSVGITV